MNRDKLFHASGLGCGQQIPLIHNAEKVGFILFTFLVHGLVIINDNVKGIAAAGLYGNKLLVGVLVIEQITGYKAVSYTHLDVYKRQRLLNTMDEKELTVMEATAEGLQKARETEDA